jgi:hypothetical protein
VSSRSLFPDELELGISTLCASEIAGPSLCERAARECSLTPFRHHLPPLSRGVRPVIAYAALNSRARGITLGRQVYIRHDTFDSDDRIPPFLLVHELAHVVQFLRDGTASFLTRYLSEYFAGLMRHRSGYRAYLEISYEVEARYVESFLPEGLQR